jgi:hypothetical protein
MRACGSKQRRRTGTLGLLVAAATAAGMSAAVPVAAQVPVLETTSGGTSTMPVGTRTTSTGASITPTGTGSTGTGVAAGRTSAAPVRASTAAAAAGKAPAAKKAARSGPMIIAHRGAADSAPESTVAAVTQAIADGVSAVEVDVRFARTGYPMVLHDATLDRTTDCSGAISLYSRPEIARCDAGSWFSAAYAGERVPKLDQVVRAVAQGSSSAKLLLHVKTLPTTTQAKRIANSVKMHAMMGRTVIIADADSILAKMATVGFTERGRVFGSPAGWDLDAEYMLPVGTPVDSAAVRRIRDRGGKVWPVESPNLPLPSLLADNSAAGTLDGVLVNSLDSVLNLL